MNALFLFRAAESFARVSVTSVSDLSVVRSGQVRSAVPLFLERFPLLKKCFGRLPDRTSALGNNRALHEPIEVASEGGAMIGRERGTDP